MNKTSKRLDQVIKSTLKKSPIIPIKIEEGILVGDVLIISEQNIKHLYRNKELLFKEISLNKAAITMANLLAKRINLEMVLKIYQADQDYGKWFVDSQYLRSQYEKSKKNNDHDKADIFWARYIDSRQRAAQAKNIVERLVDF